MTIPECPSIECAEQGCGCMIEPHHSFDHDNPFYWPTSCECGADFENGVGVLEVEGVIEVTGYVAFDRPATSKIMCPNVFGNVRRPFKVRWDKTGVCSECSEVITPNIRSRGN